MLNQGYVPCDKQIHIKLSEKELQMIRDRMAQMGFLMPSVFLQITKKEIKNKNNNYRKPGNNLA